MVAKLWRTSFKNVGVVKYKDMKKKLLFLAAISFLFLGTSSGAFAQTATSTTPSPTEKINAGILSDVWFSTTTISEKETMKIFSGFQNNSNRNLSGTATFFIDDTQTAQLTFNSNSKSLIQLEASYTTVEGKHSAQVKITEIKETGNVAKTLSVGDLLASESSKKSFTVKKIVTPETIIQTIADTAVTAYKTVDTFANDLAEYVESFKKTTTPEVVIPKTKTSTKTEDVALVEKKTVTDPKTGEFIDQDQLKDIVTDPTSIVDTDSGTSTTTTTAQEKAKQSALLAGGKKSPVAEAPATTTLKTETSGGLSPVNMALDTLAFLIRQWVWVLGAIAALALL
jgi:hypothetical protein